MEQMMSTTPDESVLIIDDSPTELLVLSGILQNTCVKVQVFNDPEAGLFAALEHPPTLVLLDMTMPGITGLEICRKLKSDPATLHVPVIFCTARADTESMLGGFSSGAVDFIRKPYNSEEVVARVKVHLDLHRTRLELEHTIVKLRQSESALIKSKEHAENIIRTANTIVVGLDIEGKIAIFNEAAEKITGYSRADLDGKNWFEVLVPRDRYPEVWERFATISRDGFPKHFENPILTKSGEERFIIWQNSVVFDHEKAAGTISFGLDITERLKAEDERRKLEQQLNLTQKLESLGVLAGGIAHDFNNLLGGIFGYIDLALDASDPGGKAAGYLERSLKTFTRAKDLTQQLLTFAKGGAPTLKVAPIVPFLKDATNFALSGSKVACVFDIGDDPGVCEFDENQLGQVVDNIVINAVQAMPLGGTLSVAVRSCEIAEGVSVRLKAGRYVHCMFTDTGIGIPAEIITRIFDPFFTTKQKGNGLGLATAFSIIQKHNGDITVDSVPGRGSTFHVYLPASTEPPSSCNGGTSLPHKGSGIVLIMDDEDYIREILGEMVEGMGYTAEYARHGREALDILVSASGSGRRIKAVILDLTVPGAMGGMETIGELRSRYPQLPVFVASGYSDDPVMADPAKFGFTGKIGKPFRIDELKQLFLRYLPEM